MKLKNWKDFFKNKASAGLVLTGVMAVAVVTAISLNQGSNTEEGPLIDWEAEGGKDQAKDNDNLLENDNYVGNLPSVGGDTIHNQVDIIGSGALDLAEGNTEKQEQENGETTPKQENQKPDQTASGESEPEQSGQTGTMTAQGGAQEGNETEKTPGDQVAQTGDKPDEITGEGTDTQPVSGITVESLSFQLEDGLTWPVHGNILLPFSTDHVVYHATLNQFKINPALLIECEPGTEILAPVRGIITEVVENPMTGWTVTMAVGDDYTLTYGQLEQGELAAGDVLEAGDTLGVVARVTKYYTMEGNHLYFQMKRGEEILDPTQYLRTE